MHKVLSASPSILKYRGTSCFCRAAECIPNANEDHHIGQWCVVHYDDAPYSGIILQLEEDNIKVKCMHRNGLNKLFWPSPRNDVSWYSDDQIMCLIPGPRAVNKRSVLIEQHFWEFIMGKLDK
ncbi:hypothetical protein XENOCAPTIV_015974 [Xenoophorus captivus]|uniref:Uncharacterized protein n=1 Tax=Xenoophorus captivus TaxID=1517983 RepID=A0ABV0S8A3_9TELE